MYSRRDDRSKHVVREENDALNDPNERNEDLATCISRPSGSFVALDVQQLKNVSCYATARFLLFALNVGADGERKAYCSLIVEVRRPRRAASL